MRLSQRVDLLDIARCLGMFAVIIGHVLILFALQPLPFNPTAFSGARWIYAFHMPLFFFLSGVTYRRQGITSAVIAAITFIFLAQVTHLVGLALADFVTGRDTTLKAILRPVILLEFFSLGVTWFLVAIGVARLLFTLFMEGGPRLKAAAILLFAVSLCVSLVSDIKVFQIHTWWVGVLFYALGHLSAKWIMVGLDPQGHRAWPRGWIVMGAVLSAAATTLLAPLNLGCQLLPFDTCGSAVLYGHPMVRMITGEYGFLPLFVLTAICGTACLVFLSALMASLPLSWRQPWIWAGRNSLTLLILNGCFLVTANGFIRMMMKEVSAGPWLLCLGVLVLHAAVLPFAIPVVNALQRGLHWVANAVVSRVIVIFSARGLFANRVRGDIGE